MRYQIQTLIIVTLVIMASIPIYYWLVRDDDDGRQLTYSIPGFYSDDDGDTHVDNSTEVFDGRIYGVTPHLLLGGQINQLSLDSKGKVAFPVPAQALPVVRSNGDYQVLNVTYLSLEPDDTFYLLIAPTASQLNLSFYGHGIFMEQIEVEAGPDPMVSGSEVYDLMEVVTDDDNPPLFDNGYNERYVAAYSPGLERGAEFFASLFESYGLETEIQRYTNPDTGALILNVIAIKWGLDESTFIGVGGHMDVAAPVAPIPGYLGPGYGTIQGAYDDTSGTVHTLLLAKALSTLQTQNTYFFGLWSAEEEGIWGSGEFVDSFAENYPGATIKAYLNLDMVGINWPGINAETGVPFPLYGNVGGQVSGGQTAQVRGFEAIINWTAYSFMGYSNSSTFLFGHSNMGRSDHRSFQNIGVPSAFYIGAYDEGYDAYHRLEDTLSNMKEQMGGQDQLEAGFQVTVWFSMINLLLLDNEDAA